MGGIVVNKSGYLVAVLLGVIVGLACTSSPTPGGPTPPPDGSASPDPTPGTNGTPVPTATPDPQGTPTPNGTPTPSAEPGAPSPPPSPAPGDEGLSSNGALVCPTGQVLVNVPAECAFDGVRLGCCPTHIPFVTDDCMCTVDPDAGPSPTPAPTPPPYSCPEGTILVPLPAVCDVDAAGYGCCPPDKPIVDDECFCTEAPTPE